ncbi:MAG: S4 domain-containing protein [bacterium]|nr:S4 domain-containing protein [bacterium]
MESIKTNAEILSDARSWIAEVLEILKNDSSQKINILSPFLDPWTLAVTISELIDGNLRWRSVAPNNSPRLQCVQVTHGNNLLDWQKPVFLIVYVRPENLFDPPARLDMLETLTANMPDKVSFGDILKIDKGWAVCIANAGDLPEKLSCFTLQTLKQDQVDGLPPATQSGKRNANVSASRIDAVASKVLKPSREQVKKLIVSGGVLINYRLVRKSSAELSPGDIVAVRGGGRFRLDSIGGPTKNGRFNIEVEILNGP